MYVTIQRISKFVFDIRYLLTHMDVGNAGYAWSNYLPRRRREYIHGRSRHPASHDTCTSLYIVGLDVGNADYTGAIICLPQSPDSNHLVKILVISQ